jgi:hypothetical protein
VHTYSSTETRALQQMKQPTSEDTNLLSVDTVMALLDTHPGNCKGVLYHFMEKLVSEFGCGGIQLDADAETKVCNVDEVTSDGKVYEV